MDFLNRFKEEFGETEYEEILEEIKKFEYENLSDDTEILNKKEEIDQTQAKELTNLEIAKI